MERLLFECAVRAIFIAAGAALVLRLMGVKTAAERHRAWTVVVILMLVLPLWTALGPNIRLPILSPVPVETGEPVEAAAPLLLPSWSGGNLSAETVALSRTSESARPAPAGGGNWKSLLMGIYLAGVFVMLLRLAVGMRQARKLVRGAVLQDGRLTSGSCSSPITVGLLDPVVILPIEWQQWPADQLKAILTHEEEHAGRYHPLAQWFALLNRALFWFHPLAWWLERRMAALAEESCDAAVLAAGHSPQDYSECLLNLARSMMQSGKRIRAVGMAMPGSSLNTRIRQILAGIPSQRISGARVACTIACFSISAVVFGAATLSPRDVYPLNSKAAMLPVPEEANQNSVEAMEEQQTDLTPATSPVVVALSETPAPAPLEITAVSSEEIASAAIPTTPALQPELSDITAEDQTAVQTSTPNQDSAPPPSQLELALPRASAPLPGAWWTDELLLFRLGLNEAQRARIEEVAGKHRRELGSSRDRLRTQDALLAQLLAADRLDSQAVLAQIDRVVQARAQLERASAALNLEVRGHLSQVQWAQLRAVIPITTIDYSARPQRVSVFQVRP